MSSTPESGLRPAGANHGLQRGQTVGEGRQGREVGERLRLVPVAHRVEAVRAVVRVAVLDRVLQGAGERHRVVRVPTVEAVATPRALRGLDQGSAVPEGGPRDGTAALA